MTKIKIKSLYKPGQLLTINHKVYRVKRARSCAGVCYYCDARNECFTRRVGSISCTGTPSDCYLQLITPKSSAMAKIKKMYKPGQLLTINGKVYRLLSATSYTQILSGLSERNSTITNT